MIREYLSKYNQKKLKWFQGCFGISSIQIKKKEK